MDIEQFRENTIERQSPGLNGSNGRVHSDHLSSLRTQGEIEADVCEVVRRYSLEYMGRGPKDVRAHLLGDLLVVRMFGVLTVAEQHLAAKKAERGKRLLKQIRSQLIEAARNEIEAMIRVCTCVNVLSLHHDISTVTGEEIIVFTLDEAPMIRLTKRK